MAARKDRNIDPPKIWATFFVEDAVECISLWNGVLWKSNRDAHQKDLHEGIYYFLKFGILHAKALEIATNVFKWRIIAERDAIFNNIMQIKPKPNAHQIHRYILKAATKLNIDRFDHFFIFLAIIGNLCTQLRISGSHCDQITNVIDATQLCLQRLVPGQLVPVFAKIKDFTANFLNVYDYQKPATAVSDASYCNSISSSFHKSHLNVTIPYGAPFNSTVTSLSSTYNLSATLPHGTSYYDVASSSSETLHPKSTPPYGTSDNNKRSSDSHNSHSNVALPNRFSCKAAATTTSDTSHLGARLPSGISYYNTESPNYLHSQQTPLPDVLNLSAHSTVPHGSHLNGTVLYGASCYAATSSTPSYPNAIVPCETSSKFAPSSSCHTPNLNTLLQSEDSGYSSCSSGTAHVNTELLYNISSCNTDSSALPNSYSNAKTLQYVTSYSENPNPILGNFDRLL